MQKRRIIIVVALIVGAFIEGRLPVNGFFSYSDGSRVEDWAHVSKGSTRYIADERWFYYDYLPNGDNHDGIMNLYSEVGKSLEPYFRNVPAIIAVPGAMNMIVYYANFSEAINEFGLTDARIAHSALSERGHIGHEKIASKEYLESRHADFELGKVVTSLPQNLPRNVIAVNTPEANAWVLVGEYRYNKPLTDTLNKRFQSSDNSTLLPVF